MHEVAELPEWTHIYSGKVRDLYARSDEPERVLVVASDRVSAYDHVLTTPIPDKGRILTAMTLWWFDRLDGLITDDHPLPNHLMSLDVPEAVAGRAMICRRLDMVPVECVARGYLTGSGLSDYRATGSVCGVALPAGLEDGSKLAEPIFTPATKAALGEHDENVTYEAVRASVGDDLADRLRRLTVAVYAAAAEITDRAGIILADTKFEFGSDPSDPSTLVLADEILTPDSSRYWPKEHWQPGRRQPSFDKQIVRDWLTSPESGWDRHGSTPPPPLPDHVVERTRERYLEAYRRLTGQAWA
ncbi:MAG: phosphoribosylaminoimidazolesuccinocarboxamide synthase [Actinomycetales bacterium]